MYCAGYPQHDLQGCQSNREVVMKQANLEKRYTQLKADPPPEVSSMGKTQAALQPHSSAGRTTSSSSVDDAFFVCPLHGITELQG